MGPEIVVLQSQMNGSTLPGLMRGQGQLLGFDWSHIYLEHKMHCLHWVFSSLLHAIFAHTLLDSTICRKIVVPREKKAY